MGLCLELLSRTAKFTQVVGRTAHPRKETEPSRVNIGKRPRSSSPDSEAWGLLGDTQGFVPRIAVPPKAMTACNLQAHRNSSVSVSLHRRQFSLGKLLGGLDFVGGSVHRFSVSDGYLERRSIWFPAFCSTN